MRVRLPNAGQYRSATGYGCPDTDVCDSQYYGFKNQLENAASLFRYILDNGSRFKPVGNNYIQYNPDTGCGGSTVYIENRATSALYQYTPYQPNWPALNAGYGTGDYCSAYGNRNFYLYFADWFGNPQDTGARPSNVVLPDGTYSLKTAAGTYLGFVDSRNGSEAQIFPHERRFAFRRLDSGYYYITDIESGRRLDLDNASQANGTKVQLWDATTFDTCAQKWAVFHTSNENYAIRSSCSGKALDVDYGRSSVIGTRIQEWEYNANYQGAQSWIVTKSDPADIPDGEYNIKTLAKASLVVDDSSAHISTADFSSAQRYRISKRKDGTFRIIEVNSEKLLTSDLDQANGRSIRLERELGSCNQYWLIAPIDNGKYNIRSLCSGKSIDIDYARYNNHGSKVQLWDYSPNYYGAQTWMFYLVGELPGSYRIVSGINQSVSLGVLESTLKNGSNIVVSDTAEISPSQSFQFVFDPSQNVYRIRNLSSGLLIDLDYASREKGANIQLWSEYGQTCAQKWHLQNAGGEYYNLVSGCSENVIDISNAHINRGNNIWSWDYNNSNAQRWKLIPID